MTTVALYATDTMADWEYGYLVAGLAMAGGELRVFGAPGVTEVRTMGGLRLLVDPVPDGFDALVLPGADTWESGHDEVLDLARRSLDGGVTVAGICGATFGLA